MSVCGICQQSNRNHSPDCPVVGVSVLPAPSVSEAALDVALANMAEFRDRLHRAESTLLTLIDATDSASPERSRLEGKRQGVRLALDYLREMI